MTRLPDPLADPFGRDREQRASRVTHVAPAHPPEVMKALARLAEGWCPDFEHERLDHERWCAPCRVHWSKDNQETVECSVQVTGKQGGKTGTWSQTSKVRPGFLTQQQVRYMVERVWTDLRLHPNLI